MNFSGISKNTLLGKALRWPLRLLPGDLCLPVVQGPLRGKRWIVGSSNHGCWLGSYEWEMQQIFRKFVGCGQTVFDVGGNVGFYTLLASVLVGEGGQVVVFEPATENVTYLKRHIQLNHLHNVRVVEAAVADRSGTAHLKPGASRSTARLSNGREGAEVEVVALDDLWKRGLLPVPHCMKIDVEGAELRVLKGTLELLRHGHPALLLATHSEQLRAQCCGILAAMGYELAPIGVRSLEEASEILATWGPR